LRTFEFLPRWGAMSPAEKLEKYSQVGARSAARALRRALRGGEWTGVRARVQTQKRPDLFIGVGCRPSDSFQPGSTFS